MARYYRERRMMPRGAGRMPETVRVAPIHAGEQHDAPPLLEPSRVHHEEAAGHRGEHNPEKRPEAGPVSFIDRILSFLSPLFTKLFGRKPELEDLILAGVILLFLYDRVKSKKENADCGETKEPVCREKKESGLAALLPSNFSDQDLLLLALFYIFL